MRALPPLLLTALFALPLRAEPPAAEGPAARLVEAHRLADLGQTLRDPVLLFAAARLMQGLALRDEAPANQAAAGAADWTAGAKTPGTGPADWAGSATVPDPAKAPLVLGALDAAALFGAARRMAPEDSALRDAIAEAAAEIPPPPASLTLSQHKGAGSLALTLPGGDPVQIAVLRLTGPLAFTLTAPDGTVLCQDGSTSAASLCTVTLPESQALTLTTTGAGDWLLATP